MKKIIKLFSFLIISLFLLISSGFSEEKTIEEIENLAEEIEVDIAEAREKINDLESSACRSIYPEEEKIRLICTKNSGENFMDKVQEIRRSAEMIFNKMALLANSLQEVVSPDISYVETLQGISIWRFTSVSGCKRRISISKKDVDNISFLSNVVEIIGSFNSFIDEIKQVEYGVSFFYADCKGACFIDYLFRGYDEGSIEPLLNTDEIEDFCKISKIEVEYKDTKVD